LSFTVIDIETNAIDNPDKLWCIVCKNLDTGDVTSYSFPSGVPGEYPKVMQGFLSSTPSVSAWIGHNVLGYDLPHLCRLLPGFSFDPTRVIDTLVVCRTLNYSVSGGNSLDAWGERLDFPKTLYTDFSAYSPQMLDYCINDVLVTEKLYAELLPYLHSIQHRSSLRLEHDTAHLCTNLHDNGFYFDIEGAKSLHLAVSHRGNRLADDLRLDFPPKPVFVRGVHPKLTKSGTLSRVDFRWLEDSGDLTSFNGGPFSRIAFEPFNPGSPKQCVERLWECGWQPFDKTKGHVSAERELDQLRRSPRRVGGRRVDRGTRSSGSDPRIAELEQRLEHFKFYGWKVNEANLATLPRDAPEAAQKLVEWLMLDSRRSTLEEWFEAYNPATHRIHGRFNHIGAWTGRMSHNSPNMANIPGHGSPFGDEFRALWQAEPGKFLVGVDADGIQLRVLAHYMNDKDFIAALTQGRKEDGTDAHTINQRALGSVCNSRDVAKTFIYAFLLGAGTGKVAEILGCSTGEAKSAVESFIAYYPGLRDLKDYQIPADAARGYFIGLDGRIVLCDSEHLMLAGYLQNGEAVIMKTANLIWQKNLRKEGIVFKQVNFVHDEWQVEVNSLTDATIAGNIMVSAIEEAGKQLKLNCPLAGNAKIGTSWLDTH
jgi:DNA polymerase I